MPYHRNRPFHPNRLFSPISSLISLIILLVGLFPAAGWAKTPVDAVELMRLVDEMWRGKTSRAKMTMTVKTRRYERSMTLEAWSEGSEKSLIRILSPKKDRGIATLKVEKNIWNYLPKVNRVTKVPASMMMGSWMGSHFTNDDLVKESSFEKDYASEITFTGKRDGMDVYEVTSTPRLDAAVVWGKVVTIVSQTGLLPVKALYFDEEGKLTREMAFQEPTRFGQRTVPAVLLLTTLEKPEEFTAIRYETLEYDIALPDRLFSLSRLRSSR